MKENSTEKGITRRVFLKGIRDVGAAVIVGAGIKKLSDLAVPQGQLVSLEFERDCKPEIVEFEYMLAAFEAEHSLVALHDITDLTPQEAPNHPIREPARIALFPIVKKLEVLKDETNISTEQYEELKGKYKRLSRAVGMINQNQVRHD